jgi:hypothetical protein
LNWRSIGTLLWNLMIWIAANWSDLLTGLVAIAALIVSIFAYRRSGRPRVAEWTLDWDYKNPIHDTFGFYRAFLENVGGGVASEVTLHVVQIVSGNGQAPATPATKKDRSFTAGGSIGAGKRALLFETEFEDFAGIAVWIDAPERIVIDDDDWTGPYWRTLQPNESDYRRPTRHLFEKRATVTWKQHRIKGELSQPLDLW